MSKTEVKPREARFMPNPINPSTPFTAQTNLLMFAGEFFKHYDIMYDSSLDNPNKAEGGRVDSRTTLKGGGVSSP